MITKNNFILFWGGIYSQWHASSFTIDGITYETAEQYMMAEKARLFKDFTTLDKILKSSNPKDQKRLGREVKNFNKALWDEHCREIVYRGNYAKFTQNPNLKRQLLSTSNLEIVEASPYDTIWGIGLHETDPLAWNKKTWKGTNWLGEAIMRVRETLGEENKL